MEEEKMCGNCKRGRSIPLTNDFICVVNGVVSGDYVCRKYDYNYFLKKSVRNKDTALKFDFEEKDFSIV